MGVDASRVKMALQRRVLQSLPMYANVNQLLDAAFREHREQVGRRKYSTGWGWWSVTWVGLTMI